MLGILGIVPTSALATSTEIGDTIRDAQKEIRDERTDVRTDVKAKMDNLRTEIKEMRASSTGATNEEKEAMREAIKNKKESVRAEVRKEIENFKEGRKVRLDAARREKVGEILRNAFNRFNKAIERLVSFDKRISEAIAKRKSKGLDTSSSESALNIAKVALDAAKTAVEAIDTGITDSLNASTTASVGISKEALKEQIRKAHDAIKNAQSKYRDVIKALPKHTGTSATTTATSS